MFASISASSSARSGRDTGSRSHALRAESSLPDAPWTRPKSPGKENVHGAIPLQQAGQGAPAQGQARGQGGSQARPAREGGGGGRRRHRLESGGWHHTPTGHRHERRGRAGLHAGRREGAGSGPLSRPREDEPRRAGPAGVNGRSRTGRSTGRAEGARPSASADGRAPRTRDLRASAAGTPLASRPGGEGRGMHLRYALLALLGEGEAHGYELLKRFNRRIGPFWHPNIGQVYQLLHELERRGLVVRRDEGAGSRARRIFRLTPRGERALGSWLARRPGWPAPLREEIFVRLLAAERRGHAALLAQIERQEIEYHRYLSLVREQAARPDASVTRRLAHEAALGQAEAHLRWLARCRALLGGSQLARAS